MCMSVTGLLSNMMMVPTLGRCQSSIASGIKYSYKASVMVATGKYWKMPNPRDTVYYGRHQIIRKLKRRPTPINSRGHFQFADYSRPIACHINELLIKVLQFVQYFDHQTTHYPLKMRTNRPPVIRSRRGLR